MHDSGFSCSWRAVEQQLNAMPAARYLIRLVHFQTRRPFPGERVWTASQVMDEPTLRFLRARNREGFDVYCRPYAVRQNAGYILVDLDHAPPTVLASMRFHGHEPCVAIETSPGHLQAWLRISEQPLAPLLATRIARHLAHLYQGDRASADWCHVGRLAGFTNQKPQRRLSNGWPPWVKIREAYGGLASGGPELIDAVSRSVPPSATAAQHVAAPLDRCSPLTIPSLDSADDCGLIGSAEAVAIYQTWVSHWRIAQRFPVPDWSIVDLWIAKVLLARGMPGVRVKAILRLASPQFPRSHADPEDYLRRTLARAVQDTVVPARAPFPARQAASSTR
jgi:hypothetical protein